VYEKVTSVTPAMMRSSVSTLMGPHERRSKMRQLASSEPVPTQVPEGKNSTALTSETWPVKVRTQAFARMSHTLTVESQEPEAKRFLSIGCAETLRSGGQRGGEGKGEGRVEGGGMRAQEGEGGMREGEGTTDTDSCGGEPRGGRWQ